MRTRTYRLYHLFVHRIICCLIAGGGILFLALFVAIFGLPILLIEFIEKRFRQGKWTARGSR